MRERPADALERKRVFNMGPLGVILFEAFSCVFIKHTMFSLLHVWIHHMKDLSLSCFFFLCVFKI